MTPVVCPNCSGQVHDYFGSRWVIGRPQAIRGHNSGRWFLYACCSFSGKSSLSYDTEEAACESWKRYRDAKGPALRGEAFMAALLEYEAETEARLAGIRKAKS